ncbi:sigma-70 family RNA polymerase sigma factor [Arcanobacterium phocisimile]|uniref:Sigma-70 family RNA polymerase sigma factor n=1 Tax=Arcanobacterium phocisimile TaxID=1302235 RepID=A0ABX7IF88_9ACTO|nr:sigma-70 family RNA polymerase sigma factor [Arcanobacterium phocisimile]QRV01622.1 sigma-70 family RNA polymerase sigma factor [Arcanobacterium phocisimile]
MITEPSDLDDVLLGRIANGDSQAFATFYDRWSGKILALIRQILRDHSQSEEVLQEVFLEVWQKAPQFASARGTARGWLVTVARRRAIDRVRSSQAARDRDTAYVATTIDYDHTLESVEQRLETENVRRMLDFVGEPQSSTIKLAFFSGLTHREIADYQRVPLGTVKTRIRDGLAKMKRFMEQER